MVCPYLGIVQTTDADRSQGSLYIDIDLQHLSLFVCQDGHKTHMLLNPKALLEEDGSVDHDIDDTVESTRIEPFLAENRVILD